MSRRSEMSSGVKALAVIAFILVAAFVANWAGIWPYAAVPESRIVYPLFSSVCCRASEFAEWVRAPTPTITNFENQYTCPLGTTQCRMRSPRISCPGISWQHPLGYTGLWSIQLRESAGTTNYCNLPLICNSIPDAPPREFKPTESIYYAGACVDNIVFINPMNIPALLSSLYNGITPTQGEFDVDYVVTRLWRYPAMGGEYAIPNTELCVVNDEVYDYAKKLPVKGQEGIVFKVKNVIRELLPGVNIEAPRDTLGDLIDRTQLLPGQCYLAVDKWIDLPFFGNVNPLGQYKGSDVICGDSTGIIKIEELSSYENVKYFVPTERLVQPTSMFCCEHQKCRNTFGVNFNCVDYQCKEVVGYCDSDIQCQPMGGELIDANCYREGGGFFKWESKCDLTAHRCTPATKESVACCPAYCSQFGKWCDFQKGCMDPVIKQDCGAGSCCNVPPLSTDELVSPYKTQVCGSGLVCCPSNDPYKGTCKPNCETIVDKTCNDECARLGYDSGHCALKPGIDVSIIGLDISGRICPKGETSLGFMSHGCLLKGCCCQGSRYPWLWMMIFSIVGFGLAYGVLFKDFDDDSRRTNSLVLGGVAFILPYVLTEYANVILPDIQSGVSNAVNDLIPNAYEPAGYTGAVIFALAGAILGFTAGLLPGALIGAIFGGLLGYLLQKVLETLILPIVVVGGGLGMSYSYDALGEMEEKSKYILSAIAGFVVSALIYYRFWHGIAILGIYILFRSLIIKNKTLSAAQAILGEGLGKILGGER